MIQPSPDTKLVAIKLLHTVVWIFFVTCILLIPLAVWLNRPMWAAALAGVLFVECAILALNHGRCPLTDVAAKYTDQRNPNFDIYLPEWLARYNKAIFGTIFVVDLLYMVWRFFLQSRPA